MLFSISRNLPGSSLPHESGNPVVHGWQLGRLLWTWIPASAGMTTKVIFISLALCFSTAYAATQVNIGVIYDAKDSQQKAALQGVQLALAQAQHDNKKSKYKFSLVSGDGASVDTFKDTPVILNLTANNNKLLLNKVLISTSANTQNSPYDFSVAASNSVLAGAAAQYIFNQLHRERAIVLFQNNPDGKQFASYFANAYTHINGQVDLNKAVDLQALPELVTAIHMARGKVIYLAVSNQQAVNYINQLRQAGIKLPIMLSADLSAMGPSLKIGRSWADGIFYTTQTYFDSNFETDEMPVFIKQYTQQYKTKPKSTSSVLGYDAAQLAITAIRNANSPNGNPLDPKQIANAIATMQSFPAASGTINYTTKPPIKFVTVVKLTAGKGVIAAMSIPQYVAKEA